MKRSFLRNVLFVLIAVLSASTAFAQWTDPLTGVTFTTVGGTNFEVEAEGADKACDGNVNTKLCTGTIPAQVVIQASTPIKLTGYTITTANDNASYKKRNPKNWTIEGSNDNISWTNLLTSTAGDATVLQDVNFAEYSFTLASPTALYQYFRFTVTEHYDDWANSVIQYSEFHPIGMVPCSTQGDSQDDSHQTETGYVFYSSSRYLYNNNGAVGATQTFSPSTCVWTWANSRTGKISNNGYNFKYQTTGDSFNLSISEGSNCTSHANESGSTGGKVYIAGTDNGGEYLRYNSGWGTSSSTSNATACYFEVTKHTYNVSYTNPAFSVTSSNISTLGTTAATCSRTTNAAYKPGYFDYVFLNGVHHYFKADNTTSIDAAPSAETFTYTWGLEGIDPQYATISTGGVINYIQYVPEDVEATITLTATSANCSFEVCKQVTFSAPKEDPTGIAVTSSNSMTIYKGRTGNITYTLTPNPCYNNVAFSSANTSIATVANGTVTGVSIGQTTITLQPKLIGGTDASFNATVTVTVKDKVATPVISFEPTDSDNGVTATATITCTTDGASIYYTTDGTTPTSESTLYNNSSFSVDDAQTVKAIAIKDAAGWDNSEVATNTYVRRVLPIPTIEMINGSVTFSCSEPGVTFHYTTNGDAPSASSTSWDGITLTSLTNESTIKVIATKSGWVKSAVASRQYIQASGVSGKTVTINDYEDHNWSYYKGLDYTLEDGTTTYNDKYKYSLYSPDPRNVKITYRGYNTTNDKIILNNTEYGITSLNTNTSPRVSTSEPQNTFVYYETLEKFVIGFFTQNQTDGDYDGTPANSNNTAEQYPYTVISNPFSVRPSTGTTKTYYGFAGWKVISGAEYIQRASGKATPVNNTTVLDLDEIIHFKNLNNTNYTPNCTSAEVVFEATWNSATVHTSHSTDAYSFSGGTYETNFVVSTTTDVGTVSPSSPCTITAIYPDGTSDNSTSRTITGLTVSTTGTTPATNTVKVEWIKQGGDDTFNANGKNMILGRGITSSSSQGTIYGSNSNITCENIVKVESGNYNTATPFHASATSDKSLNCYMIFGCDYDRARADCYITDITGNAYNTKLKIKSITANVSSGYSSIDLARANGQLYFRALFKSGYFCYEDNGQFYGHLAAHLGQRFVTLEGGFIKGDFTGGSENDLTQPNARSLTLRGKGSFRIDGRIAGGSTQRNCSGNRCIALTGGKISGWIAAGSNSGQETGGVTTGETFVYIGGNTQVDSRLFGATGSHLFNKSTGGVVYGSGCGINHNSTAGGVTKGSNVVLADNAYVERGIYGGGAMGRISKDNPTHIYILGGRVGKGIGTIQDGSTNLTVSNAGVFGGACNVGGGYSYIYMNGGIVESGVYGGSNISGCMDNDANVKIVGGQVGKSDARANVHGGGYGGSTRVSGSVNVTIGNSGATDGAIIYGDVYGGSAEGTVNIDSDDAVDDDAETNVTFNAGTINGNLYGGGLGTSTYAADVWGPVQVTVTGGEVNNVFGCNNNNGAPKSTVNVLTTGGEVHECVYGGGNAAPYTGTPEVAVGGGEVHQHVFGGGLGSTATITGSTHVTIQGTAHIDGNVYGGGNGGKVTGSTHVDIK